MSLVTNIILTTACGDEDMFPVLVEALNLTDPPIPAPVRVDQYGALGKAMEVNVYIGGYNYLRLRDFARAIEIIAWEFPEDVRLLVQGQNDEHGFHEVLLRLPGERRKIERCDSIHRAQRQLTPGEEADLMKPPYYCGAEIIVGGPFTKIVDYCQQRPMHVCYCGQLWCAQHAEREKDY
jgi:hypothetical protein